MNRYLSYAILSFLMLTAAPNAWSQALDQLGVKKGVSMSGSINASATAYTASGIESRRDPLAWYLNGNININLFGYDMPFSFNYSNQGRNYSQPFNQFRFAPSYKWARAYFGTTSMQFSNYTLAGHMFDGVGLELSPGKWRISAMYGTLLKAVPFDVLSPESYSRAAFERKGEGIKLGYEDNGNAYSISLFHAKDNAASVPYIPDDATLTPRENLAVAFNVRQTLIGRVFVDMEYSISALNRDVRAEKDNFDSTRGTSNLLGKLLGPTATTRYFDALQAGLGYTGSFYTVQLRYERVAPDFVTLGAYNVVNDMRNITVAPTVQLLGGKLNLSANAGMQVNNLDDSKTSDTKRWVANINAGFTPNEHWAFNGGYSNFSNYTRIRPLIDPYFNNPLDTLDFYQVNNTYNGMVMYRTGTKERQHAITLNTSYQYASDKSTAADAVESLSRFFTANLGYSYNLQPKALSMTGAVNYYKNTAAGLNTTFMGPAVSVNKQYFDKTLRTGVTATYNVTKATTETAGLNSSTTSSLFNTGLSLNYSPKPRQQTTSTGEGKQVKLFPNRHTHNFGATVMWLMRGAAASQPGYNELTTTINYTYSF
ncbi:hypothetical protein F0L74_21050 [Chitinophaga agrisoli]|uniref:DUF5723 domain-containing protein n=1 Tax=Chitinophaga agrisoli TaxID=2607653 RepID=A0A5B2VJ62_9BACT|nr:hypothetical protein [Chitinophaga agrisoli]KAA2238708.1 hypothetical protein F0L74_21050 [Chitinophaga agrisoli]